MNARIAALAERNRRAGHDPTVRVRHVKPEPRTTPKKRRRAPSVADTGYPGWTPTERECRRDGCDVMFVPSMPSQAYHSIECRDEAVRAQRRVTDKGKRERRAKRLEEARGPRTRVCALDGCDVEFEPPYPRSLYCSPEHSDEARLRSRRRSQSRIAVSPDTRRVIEEIERLERELGGRLPELARDYLVLLWKKVNEDPDCPPHVYDRLEHMLGLPPARGSTIAAA